MINVVCDRALLGAFTREEHRVSAAYIRQAASEVYGRPIPAPWLRWATYGSIAAAVALVGVRRVVAAVEPHRAHGDGVRHGTRRDRVCRRRRRRPTPAILTRRAGWRRRRLRRARPVARAARQRHDHGSGPRQALRPVAPRSTARTAARVATRPRQPGPRMPVPERLVGTIAHAESPGRPDADRRCRPHPPGRADGADRRDRQRSSSAAHRARCRSPRLSRYWFGDFLLLWKPPMALAKSLAPGMRGADVRWLRDSMRAAQGLPQAPAVNDVYDDDLTRLVQEFQRQHRLNVDGVAGVSDPDRARHGAECDGLADAGRHARATGGRLNDVVHPRRAAQIGARAAAPEGARAGRSPHRCREAEDQPLGRLRPSRCW